MEVFDHTISACYATAANDRTADAIKSPCTGKYLTTRGFGLRQNYTRAGPPKELWKIAVSGTTVRNRPGCRFLSDSGNPRIDLESKPRSGDEAELCNIAN